MKWIFFISLPFFALDQVTKNWILRSLPPDGSRIVIHDWFWLVNITNTGAAFGSFSNNNAFFIGLSLIALAVVLALLLKKQARKDAWRDLSLALLLGGVLGNFTDRIAHGHVIDFLLFDLHVWPAHPWPAFNVADSCICVAVVLFIIHALRQKPPDLETR